MKDVRGYLIRGGRVIDPSRSFDRVTDLLIEGGVIRAIGDHAAAYVTRQGYETIDAKGLVVAPGFVDLHVHFREPGTEGETIASGAESAVAGGFTTVCVMPNTTPAIDSGEKVAWQHSRGELAGKARVRVVGALTSERKGERCSDINDMAKSGVVALSDDGSGVMNAGVMLDAMNSAVDHGLPVSDHAEDACLAGTGIINFGEVSKAWGVPGKPPIAEEAMIARDIELARATGAHLHVAHLSTARGVELVRRAKNDGLKVTAEVTPHHFALTERDLVVKDGVSSYGGRSGGAMYDTESIKLDPDKKMNPPLRTDDDRLALIAGLHEGVIDAIATDHAPHPAAKKEKGIQEAPNGVIGLETAFAVAYSSLVVRTPAPLELSRVIELLSTGPATTFGIDAGTLRPGKNADVVILDTDEDWTVTKAATRSASKNTPWDGKPMRGRVKHTFVGGKHVFGQGSAP